MFLAGEARSALKWADGKVIKNEVDLQVCFENVFSVINCIAVIVIEYLLVQVVRLFPLYKSTNSGILQVLQLLGKKTEADLEKKPKVTNGTFF